MLKERRALNIAEIIERAQKHNTPTSLFFHTATSSPLEENLVLVRYGRKRDAK